MQTNPRRWREVDMQELQDIWASLTRLGICYNGCTHAELERIYGSENIIHKPSKGWFKLTRD